MPAPTSVAELLEIIKKSSVVDDARLSAYIQHLRGANTLPNEPNKLAGMMVRDAILTFFQAEQLLMGKWKRFTIGKYKVLERLGSGGMGQVFLCEHKIMRRRVAVKVLPTAKIDDTSSLERFQRESRAVAALDHPNIVRAYDIDQDDNLHFLVLEYVDGASLQEIIKKSGPMDPVRACHYVYQSALGLQHAYDQAGLIHRDIKPGNILIDRGGTVKILDMGLARFFHDEEDLLTKKYDESVLGTADYLAPEQAIDSHGVDIRADIYSLGATFYFLLTGNSPFMDGSVAQKLMWHQTKSPKPIASFRSDVPKEITAIIEKMMAKDANGRYQMPRDVADALAPFVQTPIPPPPDAEMPHLSPAAMGSSSGPATMTGPPTRVLMPRTPAPARPATSYADIALPPQPVSPPPRKTAPAPVPAAPQAPPPIVALQPTRIAPAIQTILAPEEEQSPAWTGITGDTPNPKAHSDTIKSRPAYRPPNVALQTQKPARGFSPTASNRRLLWIGLGLFVAALAIGAAFAFGLFGGKTDSVAGTPQNVEQSAGPLYVDPTAIGQANTYARVGDALLRAKAGDTVFVRGSAVEEMWSQIDRNRIAKNVIVEAQVPAGQLMIWRLSPSAPPGSSVLELTNVDGLTFRSFVFDGQGKAKNGIYLTARCPGVTFDNCRIQNCTDAAIKLSNAAGESGRPITFRNVRVNGVPGAAVSLFANPSLGSFPANDQVLIEDCLFEGPTNVVLAIDGSVDHFAFRHNRIYKAASGVVVKAVKAGQPTAPRYDLSLQGNTMSTVGQALVFESLPQSERSGQKPSQIAVTQNYFAASASVCTTPDGALPPGTTFKNNARDKASNEGNCKIGLSEIDYKFTNRDDPNGDYFLRYPKSAALAAAPGGPFGVPPKD